MLLPNHSSKLLMRWLFWFLAFNILLSMLLALRYWLPFGPSAPLAARVFAVALYAGHATLLLLLIGMPTLVLALFSPAWTAVACACLTAVVTMMALLIDTAVFRLYRFHIDSAVLNLVFSGAARDIFVFSRIMYLEAAAVAVALVALEAAAARALWTFAERQVGHHAGHRAEVALAAALLGALVLQNGLYVWADAAEFTPILKQSVLLPCYYPLTARDWARRLGVRVGDRASTPATFADRLIYYPKEPLICQPPAVKRNILMIVVECWRFDALLPTVMPNTEAFGRRCQVFEDHYSGGNSTRTGMFTLFYGMPGTYWGTMLRERRGPVLISELQRQGYELGIFGSAPLSNPEFDQTLFTEIPNLREGSAGTTPADHDQDITQAFLGFLGRKRTGPFFSWLFYDAPHAYAYPAGFPLAFKPNWDPVDYLKLNCSTDPVPVKNRYFNSLQFVDGEIGKLLDSMEQRHLLENTVVVITGDHGQEFNDLGLNFWGHNGNYSRFQTKVPLLIYWPGHAPQRITHRTCHMDVAPTLLRDLLGCRNDFSCYSTGSDLFQAGGRDFLILSNYSTSAVLEPGSVSLIQPYGIERLDQNYHPLPTGAAPKDFGARLFKQEAWFHHP